MLDKGFIIDGIRWLIGQHPPKAIPLCPKDFVKLDSYPDYSEFLDQHLKCEDCKNVYPLSRSVAIEKQYVLNKINSKTYQEMRYVNLDDEAIPLAEYKSSSKNNRFFVTSILIKSKTGLRLIVYAGERGKSDKTQIFVEPEIKRLSFDQKDLHPTDVFTKLEATFSDGTTATQSKK